MKKIMYLFIGIFFSLFLFNCGGDDDGATVTTRNPSNPVLNSGCFGANCNLNNGLNNGLSNSLAAGNTSHTPFSIGFYYGAFNREIHIGLEFNVDGSLNASSHGEMYVVRDSDYANYGCALPVGSYVVDTTQVGRVNQSANHAYQGILLRANGPVHVEMVLHSAVAGNFGNDWRLYSEIEIFRINGVSCPLLVPFGMVQSI